MIPFLENKRGFLVLVSWFQKMFHDFRRYLLHITKFPFHVFDRYEILIQAFGDFIYGTFISFRSSSPQKYFMKNRYSKFQKEKHGTYDIHFRNFSKFSESKIYKENIFAGCVHNLSCIR